MRSRCFVICAGLVLLASTSAGAQGVITVKNVEALYDAVNNPANAGAEVRVAGGRTYQLSFLKRLANGSTVVRPNEGRLVLQPGMSLVGSNAYLLEDGRPVPRGGSEVYAAPATETIIDGSDLLGGPAEPWGTGAIVSVGNGNSVREITIRSNQDSSAAIAVEIIGREGMAAEVVGCTLEGGANGGHRGVMILHKLGSENTHLNVILKNNIIRHHRAEPFGFGVQTLRTQTSGVNVSVDVTDSVIYDNNLGLLLANVRATATTTSVSSNHNIYRGNDGGIRIYGGRDSGFRVGSLGNVTRLFSANDTIIESYRFAIASTTGLRDFDRAPENSDNLVSIDLQGTQFISPTGPQNGEPSDDGRLDLVIAGAISDVPDLGAGVNNVAELKLRNLAAPPIPGESVVVYTLDADVPEPTNRVTFVGGEKKLAAYNPKVPIVVFP